VEEGEGGVRLGVPRGGGRRRVGSTMPVRAGQTVFKPFQIDSIQFKPIQTNFKPFKLQSVQKGPFQARIFLIKYCVEGFDKRNNFPYINFFRFEVYFELKLIEALEV
jgi:hypothetical protein